MREFLSSDFKFALELIGADYMVVTDMVGLILIGNNNQDTTPVVVPFENIFGLFEKGPIERDIKSFKIKIAETIRRVVGESTLLRMLQPTVISRKTPFTFTGNKSPKILRHFHHSAV